jgi:acetyl-CoA carboxylase carboxyl transferase subunit alpha
MYRYGRESDVDVTNTCKQINKKLIDTKRLFIKFDSMATCTLSRHPSRPYTLDHVRALCGDTFRTSRR